MKKVAYFECFSGASGDMLLGALLESGLDKDWFLAELGKLEGIKGTFEILTSHVTKEGIAATDVEVKLPHHEHHHRSLDDIAKIINSSDIDKKAKDLAIRIFTMLAEAEAKVHNEDINKIHFHEVGAIDAIVDIVGFSILFIKLGIDKVIVSPVNVGSGFVKAAHGVLPVPAPATLEIIKSSNWPVNNEMKIEAETLTPTGAAILATIKDEFGSFPDFYKIETVSYGAGKKNFENIANVVRMTVGGVEESSQTRDRAYVIETNIDDMQPEFYDYVFEKLFSVGALDVFLTPVIMKKTRPGCILTVICTEDKKAEIEKIIFEETTTVGIRYRKENRSILEREIKKIKLENYGEISVKIARNREGKIISAKPEYEDCKRIAAAYCIPAFSVNNLVLSSLA